jgi:hypothetical protein
MVHHIATQEVANAIVQADKMAHAAWGAKQLRDWSHQAAHSQAVGFGTAPN